jgi:hypothetical protein
MGSTSWVIGGTFPGEQISVLLGVTTSKRIGKNNPFA